MAVASLYGLECLVINLCAGEGRGTFIWTRDRAAPDPVPLICEWFEVHAFELRWLSAADAGFGVGAHRFVGAPQPLRHGTRLFEFVGYDVLRQTVATEIPRS